MGNGRVILLEYVESADEKFLRKDRARLRRYHKKGFFHRLSFDGRRYYIHEMYTPVYQRSTRLYVEHLSAPFPAHMTVKNYILMRMVEKRMDG